jgi:hypothetical protein
MIASYDVTDPVSLFLALYGAAVAGSTVIGVSVGIRTNPRRKVAALRRLLRKARRYPIASVPQGIARVVGQVKALDHKLINAPFSRIPCVAHVTVVKRVPVSASTGPEIVRAVGGVPFEVVDDTGTIYCDPSDVAVVNAVQIRRDVSRWLATSDTEALLAAHGRSWAEITPSYFLYFEESLIRHDARVTVAGLVERAADVRGAVSGDYREAPTALHLRGAGRMPLVISDDPADA